MAGTWTANLTVGITDGSAFSDNISEAVSEMALTNGQGGNPGIIDLTTTEQDISFAPLTGNIIVVITNLGANKAQYGPKVAGVMEQLGEVAVGDFEKITLKSGKTLRMRSDTSTARVRIRGYT